MDLGRPRLLKVTGKVIFQYAFGRFHQSDSHPKATFKYDFKIIDDICIRHFGSLLAIGESAEAVFLCQARKSSILLKLYTSTELLKRLYTSPESLLETCYLR
jgi:hypothetical protein